MDTHSRDKGSATRQDLSDPAVASSALEHAIAGIDTRAFARDVIARLAERAAQDPEPTPTGRPSLAETDLLCHALISDSPKAAMGIVEAVSAAGVSADSLYLDFLAPAARRLGVWWEDDDVGFLDVTLGLARVHGLIRHLEPRFFADGLMPANGFSAVFAPVPGEQHVLGITMAADFFRRAGWSVGLVYAESPAELVRDLGTRQLNLIGLSAGGRTMIDCLTETVAQLRGACPGVRIALGGYLTELEPGIAERVGADMTADSVVLAPHTMRPAAAALR